jgi:hypothetical protein
LTAPGRARRPGVAAALRRRVVAREGGVRAFEARVDAWEGGVRASEPRVAASASIAGG